MPKKVLGIIGGGQLGSMLASAARKVNIKTIIICDDPNAPAKKFADEFILSNYNNDQKIEEFAKKADIVTFEFENIPYLTLEKINKFTKVLPEPNINKIIQNRLTEKDFLNKINIKTTLYASIENEEELKLNKRLLPGLLKTCTLGYDGKGQHEINSIEDINNIKLDPKKKYILEKLVKLKKEFSVIVTRFASEKYEIYEPIENYHEEQILKNSKIPSDISDEIKEKSKVWSKTISEKLNYIGTMCVEFFIDKNENLYVNEIAPRVHNSGHLTINSHNVSQFENHIRAICSLEKIPTKKLFNAEMINLIGSDISNYRNKKFKENEFFYDYLKNEIKNKRKMGHLTIVKKLKNK